MTRIQFVRKGTSGIGNSPHGLIIPTEAAEIAGLQKGKYYLFEVRARELSSLEELENWQAKKFEVHDDQGRKVEKGKPSPVVDTGAFLQPGYTYAVFAGVLE